MWTTLWTIAIAGCASEILRATSTSAAGSFPPGPSSVARGIVSRATRARRDALLVWSAAIPSIASSTTGPGTLQPRMVRGHARDVHPTPILQEFPRISFRRPTGEVVQFAEEAVLSRDRELLLHEAGPRRIRRHHRSDCLRRIAVRSVVAEEQGLGLERQEPAEGLEVLLQIERGCRGDRHEDFVSGKIEPGGIPGVEASVVLVEDRELMGGVAGGVEEQQRMRPELESVLILDGHESVRRDRPHRAERLRLAGTEGLPRARDELRRLHEMLESPFVDVHLGPRHVVEEEARAARMVEDRKSTRLNSSHRTISYAVFCLKKKKIKTITKLTP